MSTNKHYPSLSELIDASKLPGNLEGLENALNQGIDVVLSNVLYTDYNVQVLKAGEAKLFRLTLLTKTLRVPLFSGLNLVFFKGSEANASEFDIQFEWQWPLGKYIRNFDQQGFSYAPEAFIDILIDLTELNSREEFFYKLVTTFLDDGDDRFLDFFDDLNSTINSYDNGLSPVTIEIQNITSKITNIKNEIDTQFNVTNFLTVASMFERYKNSSTILSAIDSIQTSFELLEEDHGITIDLSSEITRILLNLVSDPDEKFDRLLTLFKSWLQDITTDDIKTFLIPQFALELQNINMGLEFPRNWLIPAIPDPSNPGGFMEDPDEEHLAALVFTVGNLKYSTSKGFEFENQSAFTFQKAFIGNTGIMLEFINLKVDMSDTYNIPEADADGRPTDFQGMYAESASVALPAKWFKNQDGATAEIFGKNLLIGTGGVSGTIGLRVIGGPGGMFWANLGSDDGFKIGFHSFDIEFKQNKVLSSNIQAAMEIQKFVYPSGTLDENGVDVSGDPVRVGIEGHIHDDGSFNLTASTAPPYPIELPDVFIYHMSSLELGKEADDDFYIGTSGSIEFQGFLKDTLKLKEIDIDRLRIYSDGTIEFEGGSIALTEPIVLALGPVEITVTAIHYGSHQKEVNGVMRKFNYFGFDGGISVDPLGVEIRGDGVKFYYCTDNLPDKPKAYLHIQTLYLDLTIPASSPAAIINGWLSIPEPGESKEYAGGIKLQLPQAKISGSADMKLMPKYPAFIIDVSVDLPAPIAIGPIGIYGFRGLLGYRYVAEKEAAGLVSGVNSWYEYYKVAPRGIHVTKFNGPDKTKAAGTPFSVGIGASLGTSADNGTILNIKAMILLSIPSLFMIDGKAAVLSARLGLDDSGEPPFFAFIAVGDNSLELGFGADFKMPTATGKILKLYADVQAGFFFNDSTKWYVNVGTKTNPVTARVIDLVTITSYLMLSAKGIEAGARGEFDFKREYGPIKVHAWAYIEIGGKISFERPQFGAYMAAGVGADIDIKIVSLYASFDVLFGVEGAKPFKVYGEFRLCVSIKIAWVFKFKFCGNLSIMWEFNQEVDRTPINPLIDTRNAGTIPDLVKGVSMLSNETFELAYLGATIPGAPTTAILEHILPLDTYVDIKTEKGFLPGAITALIGGYTNPPERYTELIPPEKIIRGKEVRQVKHQYSIESLVLKSWNPSTNSWDNYNPYKALYPADPSLDNLKIGQFQKSGNQYNTIRLLATTPFSYTEQGAPGWFIPEQNGMTAASLFCEGDAFVPECANFLEKPLGTSYYCYNSNQLFYSNEAAFFLLNRQDGDFAQVVHESNVFGFNQSLSFLNRNKLQIRLPEPSVEVILRLSTYSQGVRVKYYASLIDDDALVVQYGNPDQTAVNPLEPYVETYSLSQLNTPITYSHPEWLAVTRVEIEPLYPNQAAIDALIEMIAAIEYNNNLIALGLAEGEPQSPEELYSRLIKLQSTGCQTITPREPCRKDEKIFSLYTSVLTIQQNCFVDPKQFNKDNIDTYKRCMEQIFGLLNQFNQSNPSDFIKQQLVFITQFMQQPNQDTYTAAWNALNAILNYLYKAGNCGCSDAPVTKCFTLLHSVCWLSLEHYEYNINIPSQAAIAADAQAAIDGINQYIQPIWRPDTSYVVQFSLKDDVDNGGGVGNYTYTYGFTTGGPVGFFHKNEKATYGDLLLSNGNILEDANGIVRTPSGTIVPADPLNPITPHPELYPLTSLTRYIDYNRSYPNADGNLLNSKPLFYNDETTQIYLFYAKAYATHFFHNWQAYNGQVAADGRIKIVIKDPREGTEIVNPPRLDYDPLDTEFTNIPQTIESWEDDPNPIVPFVFEQFANLINSNECLPFGGNAIVPPSQFLNVKLKQLKPLKLYTAIVNNLYDLNKNGVLEPDNQSLLPNQLVEETVEVHKFTFQTSRYASFKEQVNSFILNTENQIAIERNTKELEAAYSLTTVQAGVDTITGTPNPIGDVLIPTYPNAYDRVVEGILGLTPFTAPSEGQELRLIRDTNTGEVIAVIVLSSEPLNSTRIPESEVFEMIKVLDSSGVVDTNYKVALNTGYTQAVIMHAGLVLAGTLLQFRFQHLITRDALFNIDKGFAPAEIQAAFDTITGTSNTMSDAIVVNYQHAFDRVIEGLLALPPMDKAISTEFNAIRDNSDVNNPPKVMAVLIRNPEPFNNPKMPMDEVLDTIQVLDGSGNEDISYKKLFSKDYSQVIIMKNGAEITGPLDIRFTYKIWNGNAYIVPGLPGYSTDEIGTIVVNNIDLQNF
jgi:hypothetical protein